MHYVRIEGRMVAVYEDDVLDQVERSSLFGKMAGELNISPQNLATLVLRYFPGGNVGVPARYRS